MLDRNALSLSTLTARKKQNHLRRRSRAAMSLLAAGLLVALVAPRLHSQTQPSTRAVADSTRAQGKQIFTSVCAPCHGAAGHGGERAKNIAASPDVRRLSDAALSKIIEEGKTDKGMPSFRSLGAPKIQAVVGYVRTLQRQSAPRRGVKSAGKKSKSQ